MLYTNSRESCSAVKHSPDLTRRNPICYCCVSAIGFESDQREYRSDFGVASSTISFLRRTNSCLHFFRSEEFFWPCSEACSMWKEVREFLQFFGYQNKENHPRNFHSTFRKSDTRHIVDMSSSNTHVWSVGIGNSREP